MTGVDFDIRQLYQLFFLYITVESKRIDNENDDQD